VEAIVIGIGKQLAKRVVFKKRNQALSGMKVERKWRNAPE
jgi:hypothetical protein